MKGLDTNILVRYLTEDDPRQAAAAVKEIEGAGRKGEKLVVQPLVLCELAWVLERAYGVGKKELLDVFERILRTAQFEIPGKDLAWRSLADYRAGRGDFSDHLLGRLNEDPGYEQVCQGRTRIPAKRFVIPPFVTGWEDGKCFTRRRRGNSRRG